MSTVTETPEQALQRIQNMGFGKNDALVIMAFADRGIAPEDITPRENVLTFRAWKAKGRSVAKGAISVKVTTWIPCKDTDKQAAASKDGEKKSKLRPKTACLFHVSQTKAKGAPKDERPDAWNNPALVREGTYEAEPQCHDSPNVLVNENGVSEADCAASESTNTLAVFCSAMGWQGGTIHDAKRRFAVASPAEMDKVCGMLADRIRDISDPDTASWFMEHRREASKLSYSDVPSDSIRRIERTPHAYVETIEPNTKAEFDEADTDEFGAMGDDRPASCNCPAVGIVTNVACPIHGPEAIARTNR